MITVQHHEVEILWGDIHRNIVDVNINGQLKRVKVNQLKADRGISEIKEAIEKSIAKFASIEKRKPKEEWSKFDLNNISERELGKLLFARFGIWLNTPAEAILEHRELALEYLLDDGYYQREMFNSISEYRWAKAWKYFEEVSGRTLKKKQAMSVESAKNTIETSEWISLNHLTESELKQLFELLSKKLKTQVTLKKMQDDFGTYKIFSNDIPLAMFGLFNESLERVYIKIEGHKGCATVERPLIGFHLQWVFETKHWSHRTFEIREKNKSLVAWFNIKEQTWELGAI